MTSANDDPLDVSVVIGFKDWGAGRLLDSVHSIQGALEGVRGEVIVSDYGSTDSAGLQSSIEQLGGRYVYTATDGTWSRARALNAGFAVARGSVLISTDADMIFSPGSLAIVTRLVLTDPSTAVVLQCRDLPQIEAGKEHGSDGARDWELLEFSSRLRPRWGMGGMMATSAEAFDSLRGFDERMEVYGAEDLDFAARLRRLGKRIHWVDRDDVRMYHVWHEPTRAAVDATPRGRAAIARNRHILTQDPSLVRNTTRWIHRRETAPPLTTVVIATRDRAEFLRESLHSVRAQTVQDLEILVVDDGSTDHTREVVESFDDPRMRYLHQEPSGLAVARQRAAWETRSPYTVIHDDDDLMLPWRIEAHFEALQAGVHGTYGGWVDFENETGDLTGHPGRHYSLPSLLHGGKVYAHGTLMLETDLIRKLSYDVSFSSGADYNLALRLARSGAVLAHTEKFHILRRLHHNQVTVADSPAQKSAAILTSFMARNGIPREDSIENWRSLRATSVVQVRDQDSLREVVRPYLPDSLVQKDVQVALTGSRVDEEGARALAARASDTLTVSTEAQSTTYFVLEAVTWADLAPVAALGAQAVVSEHSGQTDESTLFWTALRDSMQELMAESLPLDSPRDRVVIALADESASEPESPMHGAIPPDSVRTIQDGERYVRMGRTIQRSDAPLEALEGAAAETGARVVGTATPWSHEDLAQALASRQADETARTDVKGAES